MSKNVFVIAFILGLVFLFNSNAFPLIPLSYKTYPAKEPVLRVCGRHEPCGFADYYKDTKQLKYYKKNSCDCSIQELCKKAENNRTVNAIIYRCKLTRPYRPLL